MFSTLTGYGLKEYIRERKLTKAAFDIIESDHKIIDIAYQYGFKTPESFSKAFKLQHNVSPIQLRNSKSTFNATLSFTPYKRKKVKPMNVRIEEKKDLLIVGKKHIISLENNQNLVEIPKLWDDLNERKEDEVLFGLNTGEVKGILGICKKLSDTEIEYWIGVNALEGSKDYESLLLKSSKYAIFEAVGALPKAIQDGWSEIMGEWIPTSGYEVDESLDLELYTDEDPFSVDLVSEIWIKLK